QVAKWNSTPDADRAALLPQFRESYAAEQKKVVEDATKFRENLETWLPLDVKPDDPKVQPVLTRAEKIAQLTAAGAEKPEAAQQALTELRAMRESLSELNEVTSTNKAKMTAHVAN